MCDKNLISIKIVGGIQTQAKQVNPGWAGMLRCKFDLQVQSCTCFLSIHIKDQSLARIMCTSPVRQGKMSFTKVVHAFTKNGC